jgi:hypothetical protein
MESPNSKEITMQKITILKMRDLFPSLHHTEIVCAVTGEVRRKLALSPDGEKVTVDAITETVVVPGDIPVKFVPWQFDRGNLTFPLSNGIEAKLCTENDILRSGEIEYQIVKPNPPESAPHEGQ